MKKLAFALTVLLCVAGFTTQAMAYFENGNLVLSVYNQDDMDLGIDLGVASELVASTNTNVLLAAAGTISLDSFTVESWSDLSAGAWASNQTTYNFYVGITEEESYKMNTSQIQGFMSSTDSVYNNGYGDSNNGTQTALISSTDLNSYDYCMNAGSNSPGTMGGLINGSYLSEANLAALAETNGYVDLNLYAYSVADQSTWVAGRDAEAVIRLMGDGSVVLNPNPVPVPGALILLSSGLIGIVGIRRKNA